MIHVTDSQFFDISSTPKTLHKHRTKDRTKIVYTTTKKSNELNKKGQWQKYVYILLFIYLRENPKPFASA